MKQYRWPGNVRELKNVIERAVVLARGDFLDTDDLNLSNIATAGESAEVASPKSTFEPMSLDEIERRHIHATLRATGWNKSRTAAILGVERSTLDRKIRRYDLKPPIARADEWQAEQVPPAGRDLGPRKEGGGVGGQLRHWCTTRLVATAIDSRPLGERRPEVAFRDD